MNKSPHTFYINPDYMKEDGTPLKCWKCESKDLKFTNHYDEAILVEISVKCNECDSDVGLWSYGVWML